MMERDCQTVSPQDRSPTVLQATEKRGRFGLVQKVLGHANLSATMVSTHIFDEEVESALKSFRQEAVIA